LAAGYDVVGFCVNSRAVNGCCINRRAVVVGSVAGIAGHAAA